MIDRKRSTPDRGATRSLSPDRIADAEHLKKILTSCGSPFVVINDRELSVLRRGLTKSGWKRSLYLQPGPDYHGARVGAGLLSVANRWLDRKILIPERSGHIHLFFCDCGSRLDAPQEEQPAPSYTCPACGKTYQGERYDGAVRYMQHNQLAGAALALALVAAVERDRAYAQKAAEILLGYAEAYPGPHTGATAGGIMFQSLCEAVWVIPLAQAYDLVCSSKGLREEDRYVIENRLFRPVAAGLTAMGIDGNWGSWHLSAVGVIGLALKDPSMVEYAIESLRSQLADQLGEDGLWPESVHSYHFYPLSAFVQFAEACLRAGIDLYNWEPRPGKSLRAMFTAPLQYAYPSFRLPAINDGWYDSFLPLDLYEVAHRRWHEPAFAWVLKKGYRARQFPANRDQSEHPQVFTRNGFYAFLFGRDLPGRVGQPVLASQDFRTLGICTLRCAAGQMITFDYGPFLGHGHLDKHGFTLYANDQLLVPDYGTPGYGSKIVDWYRSTWAHNTVVVDGESQQRAGGYGLFERRCGQFAQVVASVARDCYPGVTHRRRVMSVGAVCLIEDELESDAEHEYCALMRCEGEPEPAGQLGPAPDDWKCHPLIELAAASCGAASWRIDWKCDEGEMAFCMWSCEGEADLALGRCPAEIGTRTVSLVACRRRGPRARFLAVIAPSRSGQRAEIARSGRIVSVGDRDGADHVYVRSIDKESAGPLETDGEIAAVRTRAGRVRAFAIVGGSWLSWMGERLIECPSSVDLAEVSLDEKSPAIIYSGPADGPLRIRTGARAMRFNGRRVVAANSDGAALLRVTPDIL